jgi:hypothetical protein
MVKPPNPDLPRYHEHPTNNSCPEKASSLHVEQADPTSLVPPSSLAPSDGASTTVKVLSALALIPLLYGIHILILTPIAHYIGHGLVHALSPSPTVVTAAADGLHSFGKRELEKGSGEFIAFACLIPILVIL